MSKNKIKKIIIGVVVLISVMSAHWSRNIWNEPVSTIEDVAGWTELTPFESMLHQMGPGNENNRKFVSPDGHSEAVFRPDPDGGEPTLVTEPVNYGTYNYFGPRFLFGTTHAIFDVVPYFLFGNTPADMFNPARFVIVFNR